LNFTRPSVFFSISLVLALSFFIQDRPSGETVAILYVFASAGTKAIHMLRMMPSLMTF
jgi:hypothetical protein